jgi:hypothetical protein
MIYIRSAGTLVYEPSSQEDIGINPEVQLQSIKPIRAVKRSSSLEAQRASSRGRQPVRGRSPVSVANNQFLQREFPITAFIPES